MRQAAVFAAVGVLAALAGTALWLGSRESRPGPQEIAPAALLAATFTDTHGQRRTLAEYQGRVVVLNFWATWCAPCREEMPLFARLQERWGSRKVQFVGVSSEEAGRVERFARPLGITYPLWVGDEAGELARRLGNRASVLPFTVVLDGNGRVQSSKVGPYTEAELEKQLASVLQ